MLNRHTANATRNGMHRRQFLRRTAAGAAVIPLPWLIPSSAIARPGHLGANDRVDVALFGMGFRGGQMLDNMPETARIVAVAEPDSRKVMEMKRRKGGSWTVYSDYRRLLDKERIDAVVCCNTDHNHVNTALAACQAGTDLYVEKPFCHTIAEGRALVELAKKHGRILQAGTQSRSIPLNQLLLCGIRDGKFGKLRAVVCRTYRIAGPIPNLAAERLPEWMNWDVWLGPAAKRPYAEQLTKKWLEYEDFSQWTNGGWGAHSYDMIQHALGADTTGPVEIWPTEQRSYLDEESKLGMNTKLQVKYRSGDVVRMELDRGVGPDVGAIFVCDDAKIEINRNTFKSNPPNLIKEPPPDPDAIQEVTAIPARRGWMGRCHLRNWLESVKTRRQPNAYGELAQRAGTLCCLTTIARLVNRPLKWDPAREQFVGDDEANAMVNPPRRKGYELPTMK
jgi:hypothetical protein